MTIYLYVKTHRKTGLKYLGKTERDPFKYKGSGKYWKKHLKIHGNDVETKILKECKSEEELKEWGLYYSKLFNVVEDSTWANLMEESGNGVSSELAKKLSKKRVENGNHNFQGGGIQRQSVKKQLENGTHNFQNGEFQRGVQKQRLENGTHHLQKRADGTSLASDRVKNGTHHFQKRADGTSLASDRVKNCTHHFQNSEFQKKLAQKWACEYCGKSGKGLGNYSRWHADQKCLKRKN